MYEVRSGQDTLLDLQKSVNCIDEFAGLAPAYWYMIKILKNIYTDMNDFGTRCMLNLWQD
jgi:hypothetical protein